VIFINPLAGYMLLAAFAPYGLWLLAGALVPSLRLEKRDWRFPWLPLFLIGPLLIALDLCFRLLWGKGDLFEPARGGNILYVPVWMCGVAALLYVTKDAVVTKRKSPPAPVVDPPKSRASA